MIGSPKEWAAMLGYDRGADERTMAARARVLIRALAYLDAHFADPDGVRPPEEAVAEFGQFLVLAEDMEARGRGAKFRELHEEIVALYLNWDEIDRDQAFRSIAQKRALFKGIVAFSDAWAGIERPQEGAPIAPVSGVDYFGDDGDMKTRIVKPAHLKG